MEIGVLKEEEKGKGSCNSKAVNDIITEMNKTV
jgi:hypothetical protein